MKRTLKESIKEINNMIGRIDHPTIIREQTEEFMQGMDQLIQMGKEHGFGKVKDAMGKFTDTDNPAVKTAMGTWKRIKDGFRKWMETQAGPVDIPTMESGDTWIDFWNKFTPEQQESFILTTGIDRETLESLGSPTMNEQETKLGSGPTTPSFEFPPEIEGENDDIKRYWFCMDDRENRGWNMSEEVYRRFQLLHGAIDGMGTDEDVVWKVLSGYDPKETKAGYGIPKGRTTNTMMREMYPMLACMHSDKPWEEDYMTQNNLGGKRVIHWIYDDFDGAELCYLQNYMRSEGKAGRKSRDCQTKHGYFWWNKAANWIKELF